MLRATRVGVFVVCRGGVDEVHQLFVIYSKEIL